MPDCRVLKQLLSGQLTDITRIQGGQRKRQHEHQLRLTLKTCDMPNTTWELTASDGVQWRSLCRTVLGRFEPQRIDKRIDRRRRRKKHEE